MTGKYWDVRSCSWQGGVETEPPDWWLAVDEPAPAGAAVPEQVTVGDVDQRTRASSPTIP